MQSYFLTGGITIILRRFIQSIKKWGYIVFFKWSILHLVMGFLLGRALILQELSPFAVPYFAVMYFLRKDKIFYIGLALVFGASTHHAGLGWMTFFSLFLTLITLLIMERHHKTDLSYTPFIVLGSVLISHTIYDYYEGTWNGYALFMNGVEAVMSLVLTLIFIQSLPVLSFKKQRYQLKNEEVVCLVILLASVMTGTIGWYVENTSVEHILSRFLVLVFAFIGGGTVGATVGVVTGIILSLADINAMYQMSLLAFSGLLAGLLKEGGRLGTIAGMMIGSSILSIYVGNQGEIIASVRESAVAVLLFLLMPRPILTAISRYIPGSQEYMQSQNDYLRKVRDVTAEKVQNFARLFEQLSVSFIEYAPAEQENEQKIDLFLSEVTRQTCQKCWKKEQCWDRDFLNTYESMAVMAKQIDETGELHQMDVPGPFQKKCVKTDKVIQAMHHQLDQLKHHLQMKRQIQDARRLVGDQLAGVSRVMRDFSKEIQKEAEDLNVQEQQILNALEGLGLSIRDVEVVSLEEGNVHIRVTLPSCFARDECQKIVAPLLTNLLGENIAVKQDEMEDDADGYCILSLVSAKEYMVETGVAGAAKGGKLLSGDSFKSMDLGNGKFALAISDGMGNGERAHMESTATLELLQQLLKSGMDETLALKSVNSILSLRSTDEIFATVDLALIDLYSADTRFIKFGSTPSFVKRGNRVFTISSSNLPIGIIQDIEVDVVSEQLKPGDLLIMMTDGIYDAPGDVENKERWMKRIIAELETDDPQEVADCLLERVIRHHYGEIADDMTVMVARIDRQLPEWSAIQIPNFDKIERPSQTVS
ncbi:MAG: stage II sporulation protein E [Bacillaceae bacterium]|nr:stage II sporulation protein E [Bacillaceae bacterium]